MNTRGWYPEGAMTRATTKTKKPTTARKTKPAPLKKQHSIVAIFRELASRIPEEELRRLPTDLAEQHDHYIYGTPKK